MPKTITHENALEMIRKIVREEGSQYKAAVRLNIAPSFLGSILKGAMPISDRVAQQLGYRRVIAFEKVETPQEG